MFVIVFVFLRFRIFYNLGLIMESEEMMESDHVNGINNPEVEHDVDMQGCDPEEQRKLMERASELENKVVLF